MRYLVQLFRLLTGGLFIFSGLIKANDPKGFGFKLEEYFQIFSETTSIFEAFIPHVTTLAAVICVVEVVLGVLLLIGCRIKLVMTLLLLMILGFTFLTFYSAYYNKVTDCGCFGDAIPLTPWQSFYKDIILLIFIVVMMFGMKYIKPLFSVKTALGITLAATIASIAFCAYTIYYLPVKDFRPYAIGKDIAAGMVVPDGAPQDVYNDTWFYKVNGEVNTYTTEQAPWDIEGAEYVDRKTVLVSKGYTPPIHDLSISDRSGNDYLDVYLAKDVAVWIVTYQFPKADKDAFFKLNNFYEKSKPIIGNDAFIGLSASLPEDVDAAIKSENIQFPYFITDGTTLKTIIRSNPGMVILKKGVVVAKFPSTALPSEAEFLELIK